MTMRIRSSDGKFGKNDRIILFTSTNKNGEICKDEAVSIFKIALLLNQITYNELELKDGYKKRIVKNGGILFFEEAMKESINHAKDGINWAEKYNWDIIKEWCNKWKLKIEDIEPELKRTFQRGLNEFKDE